MKTEALFDNEMHFSLFLCTQGSCELEVNGKPARLTRGDAFVHSPLVIVSQFAPSADFVLETILHEKIEVFVPVATANFDIFRHLLSKNEFHLSLTPEEQSILLYRKAALDSHRAVAASPAAAPRQQKLLAQIIQTLEQETVLEYLNILYRHKVAGSSTTEKENSTLVRFILLLFRNRTAHRDVRFYAEALHLSPNHFTRTVKRTSGRTPSEWIALITVNQAKALLRRRDLSIKQVAEALNFPEQFTFRKYFKLHAGLSPKDFRAQHAK